METMKKVNLNSRKQPTQQRSNFTVAIIFEAAIQVLIRDGYDQFTTIKVAERAGVSVGTLYQYFPNKKALLSVMFENHLKFISTEIKKSCQQQCGKKVRDMMAETINAYISAEMQRSDYIKAFSFLPLNEIGGLELLSDLSSQLQFTLISMLNSASDMKFKNLETVSLILVHIPIGIMQNAPQKNITPKFLDEFRYHFIELSVSYLE
ncbi:TetR/AcrR family transcriptional regulator, partial [Acinetobacter bereziniae]